MWRIYSMLLFVVLLCTGFTYERWTISEHLTRIVVYDMPTSQEVARRAVATRPFWEPAFDEWATTRFDIMVNNIDSTWVLMDYVYDDSRSETMVRSILLATHDGMPPTSREFIDSMKVWVDSFRSAGGTTVAMALEDSISQAWADSVTTLRSLPPE